MLNAFGVSRSMHFKSMCLRFPFIFLLGSTQSKVEERLNGLWSTEFGDKQNVPHQLTAERKIIMVDHWACRRK